MANALIFNMGRHSLSSCLAGNRSHIRAFVHASDAPDCRGYPGSILLALAPPLWRRVMDDKVRRMGRM